MDSIINTDCSHNCDGEVDRVLTSILYKYYLNACLSKILHDRFLEDYEQLIEYQDQLTLKETRQVSLCDGDTRV